MLDNAVRACLYTVLLFGTHLSCPAVSQILIDTILSSTLECTLLKSTPAKVKRREEAVREGGGEGRGGEDVFTYSKHKLNVCTQVKGLGMIWAYLLCCECVRACVCVYVRVCMSVCALTYQL